MLFLWELSVCTSVMTCGTDKLIVCLFPPVNTQLHTFHFSFILFMPFLIFTSQCIFCLFYLRHEHSLCSGLESYVFLSEVDKVLQINVISVGSYVVVDEKVELIFNPVFEDKGQDTGSQLQEEDYPQKHRKLEEEKDKNTLQINKDQ